MNKLIIAGSRDFTDYAKLCSEVDEFAEEQKLYLDDLMVISGTCRGADKLGEQWAFSHEIPVELFPANWNKFGKSAGYIRNEAMAKYSTHCIVFIKNHSKGSQHMIDLAKKYGLILKVVEV